MHSPPDKFIDIEVEIDKDRDGSHTCRRKSLHKHEPGKGQLIDKVFFVVFSIHRIE